MEVAGTAVVMAEATGRVEMAMAMAAMGEAKENAAGAMVAAAIGQRPARSSGSTHIQSCLSHMPHCCCQSPGDSMRREHHNDRGIHRRCHTATSTPRLH